ncbi:NUDIX domain-containing protein [Patescibacteria group bacterium]|nr:NUDIX domain-containing protein [Patescibacteria group bacterium]
MDLTIPVHDRMLNIRVAVLIKGPEGYIFEKSPKSYIFPVGGRVKLGESSYDAAIREINEELGSQVGRLEFRAVIENFYTASDKEVQEICFMYEASEMFSGDLSSQFVEVHVEKLDQFTIKPTAVVEILKDIDRSKLHIVVR